MRIVFGYILISGICGLLGARLVASAGPVTLHHVISKDLDGTVGSYISISDDQDDADNQVDVISRVHRIYLDKPEYSSQEVGKPQHVKHTAYVLVKSIRQRDKRYISYLTLCHFKICNMGRKRTGRYFHMIRTLDNS